MRFAWDEQKNRENFRKHGISDEERFLTLGAIGPGAILLVVHLSFEDSAARDYPDHLSPPCQRERKTEL